MSKYLIVLLCLVGCSAKTTVTMIPGATGETGAVGATGPSGANGHSLVSQFVEVSMESCECLAGGTRLDIYQDLDDTLSVSESDSYAGSLVACNGSNGANGQDGQEGAQGLQGSVGPTGSAGADGSDGEPGPQGLAGADGIDGLDGTDGAQGPPGTGATILASSSVCTSITGSYYMKSNTLYLENDSSLCDGSHDKVELNNGDSLWLSANKLAVYNLSGLRVITFN